VNSELDFAAGDQDEPKQIAERNLRTRMIRSLRERSQSLRLQTAPTKCRPAVNHAAVVQKLSPDGYFQKRMIRIW